MSRYVWLTAAAATIALLASLPAMAQPVRYSYNNETPEQNVYMSARYDHLLETNMGFRHYRMHKECNPINFTLSLRQDCFASFDKYEPIAAGY